jgi:hypothetical protein
MFAARYFAPRYFAPRYFSKIGAAAAAAVNRVGVYAMLRVGSLMVR